MTTQWARDAVFYHIYPLGLCGAPQQNDFGSPVVPRLSQIPCWTDHLRDLGVTALYLGPLFESTSHGYDTADYFHVDRRLGDRALLAEVVSHLHHSDIRVILDGVFHHVGRDFWAFRDLLERGENSPYRGWFQGLSFDGQSPYGDPFTYETWEGHSELVKLNLQNPAVKEHLFQAVEMWVREFDIDGLRLDVAPCLDLRFLRELAVFCRRLRKDFWLLGEVIYGDYRNWVNPETLDSATNYECYKGLYSSLIDRNYYEIAFALNRQFADYGLYRQMPLYNFADNHDVDRVASRLHDPADLYPLYCLLFTMPGVPSIYYGSEWGLEGRKDNGSDWRLRPHIDLATAVRDSPHPDLAAAIAHLGRIRHDCRALRRGGYRELLVSHQQLAFARQTAEQCVIVMINAADKSTSFDVPVPCDGNRLVDWLNRGETFPVSGGRAHVDTVWPHWARVLVVE